MRLNNKVIRQYNLFNYIFTVSRNLGYDLQAEVTFNATIHVRIAAIRLLVMHPGIVCYQRNYRSGQRVITISM